MKFRPCIDIHNGKVKQIVGSSLNDIGDQAKENFVAEQDASFYARLYKRHEISGGHVILLNSKDSQYYPETKRQALLALSAYPGGLQVGGGMNAENACEFLTAGASHVIVTSYVFRDGHIYYENLEKLVTTVGKKRLTLDLSCRKKEDGYYIVTDRWQKFTEEKLTEELLTKLSESCDEFLIHAVDVEGKASGIEVDLVRLLAKMEGFPITYAGGVGTFRDLELLKQEGQNRLDVTIGSALDLFGGTMNFAGVLETCAK
ncbi:MAG: phosphoribosylformimino-5-aminoimidazole carboxamide ribotide isomerase [Fusicatenibacter sp.]|nr:phosphoribosylformimino-5-aminoimidazole carboxamide ribotide isomerase [Fusicatenibacter sp.]